MLDTELDNVRNNIATIKDIYGDRPFNLVVMNGIYYVTYNGVILGEGKTYAEAIECSLHTWHFYYSSEPFGVSDC